VDLDVGMDDFRVPDNFNFPDFVSGFVEHGSGDSEDLRIRFGWKKIIDKRG
jgi:hypothetical protein